MDFVFGLGDRSVFVVVSNAPATFKVIRAIRGRCGSIGERVFFTYRGDRVFGVLICGVRNWELNYGGVEAELRTVIGRTKGLCESTI